MDKTLNYLFDPLCGWCYGAAGALSTLIRDTNVELKLIPTGLFYGEGSRDMDEHFANYAWQNDQRIFHLTGQQFSQHYREQVLNSRAQRFDSTPATIALTAVNLTAPQREYDMLMAFQIARYIDGLDITSFDLLCDILIQHGLTEASQCLAANDLSLQAATTARIAEGQHLLAAANARGVPTFILEETSGLRLLQASTLFSSPEDFARELTLKSGQAAEKLQ